MHITQARYLDGYRVEVVFNDGKKGIADLSDALTGKVFEPLKNIDVFSKFNVDKKITTDGYGHKSATVTITLKK